MPFELIGRLGGDQSQAACHYSECVVASSDSTAMFLGDVVTTASGGGDSTSGRAIVTAITGTFTGASRGVCTNVRPLVSNTVMIPLGQQYRPASTKQFVEICDDPYAIYRAQSDGTAAVSAIGGNISVAAGAGGSTSTALSTHVLHQAGAANTSSLPFKILQSSQRVGDTIGAASGYYEVMPNAHEFKAGTTGTS